MARDEGCAHTHPTPHCRIYHWHGSAVREELWTEATVSSPGTFTRVQGWHPQHRHGVLRGSTVNKYQPPWDTNVVYVTAGLEKLVSIFMWANNFKNQITSGWEAAIQRWFLRDTLRKSTEKWMQTGKCSLWNSFHVLKLKQWFYFLPSHQARFIKGWLRTGEWAPGLQVSLEMNLLTSIKTLGLL